MSSNYLIYAIIAVGIFTAYMAIVNMLRADRMHKRVQGAGLGAMAAEDEPASAFAIFCENMVRLTGVEPADQKELALKLAQAGLQSPHAVGYFLFFRRIVQPLVLLWGSFLFTKALLFSAGMDTMPWLFRLLVAIMMLAAGIFGTSLYLSNTRQRRQNTLLYSFPEVLDLLLVCIESGLGLDAALTRACNELQHHHPAITAELDRTRIELTMLSDRVQALQNLADRTGIVPFKSLVAALIQTEKFGTSLVDTLRVLSDEQRTTRLLTAEARAARIPVLITIPIILCIFLPFFLIIILGPPLVRVIDQGGIFGHASPK